MLKDKNGNITHVESIKFDIKTVAIMLTVVISVLIAGFRLENRLEVNQNLDHAALERMQKQFETSTDTLKTQITAMHQSIKTLDTDIKHMDNRLVRLETIVDQNLLFRKPPQENRQP